MKILKCYYFRLYSYYSKGAVPFLSTFLVIAFMAFFNLLTLLSLFSTLFNVKLTFSISENWIARLWPLYFLMPIFAVFYYCFMTRGYHDKVLTEFKDETPNQKFKGNLLVIAYFIGSMTSFVLSLWIRDKIRGF